MAYEESLRSISLDADATIGFWTGVPGAPGSLAPNYGKQYCWVKVTGERTVGIATNGNAIGILQNKPQGIGHAATVGFHGVSMAMLGATVAAGDLVGPDGTGRTVPGGTNGVALASGQAGSVIPVLINVGS